MRREWHLGGSSPARASLSAVRGKRDEWLQRGRKALVGEEDAGENPHRHHHQIDQPLTLSIFWARLAVSRPRPPKESAPSAPNSRLRTRSQHAHVEEEDAEGQEQADLDDHQHERLVMSASRKSLRRMGVATKRLSSLRWRIRPAQSRRPTCRSSSGSCRASPGIRKSM